MCSKTRIILVLSIIVTSVCARYHNFEEDLTLSSDQKKRLDEFKALVTPEIKVDYQRSDMYLLKWLRSKRFNVKDAETALLKTLKWREMNKMDTILEEDFSDMEEDYKIWMGEGTDKDGKPIVYFEAATHDTRKILINGLVDRYLRFTWYSWEKSCNLVRELGEKYGNVTRAQYICNMAGFNVAIHGCLRCLPLQMKMLTGVNEYWPECYDNIILVNAPSIAEPALQVAKSILDPEVKESVQIYGTNKKYWKKILSQQFDFNELPPAMGGSKIYSGMERDYY